MSLQFGFATLVCGQSVLSAQAEPLDPIAYTSLGTLSVASGEGRGGLRLER